MSNDWDIPEQISVRAMWQKFKVECKKCNCCKKDNLLDSKAFPILMKSSPRKTDILFVLEAPNRDDTYNPDI